MVKKKSLDDFVLLGRSGLRVSPLALGTITFGTESGWGADESEAHKVFSAYLDLGGNFIDTANQYTGGTAERFLGKFMSGTRHRLVVATKYTLPLSPQDPNSGGNNRKSMVLSVERSLRQLKTDYLDILYLHAWDFSTGANEILRAMDDLVKSGKTLHVGVSNIPAWQAARLQVTAELRGWTPLVALQIEYSLIERAGERDLIPMAKELGMAVIPWSPLGGGVLTGKYSAARDGSGAASSADPRKRESFLMDIGTLSTKNLAIGAAVTRIAQEAGYSPSQVAIAWVLGQPGITCPIVGARTLEQFRANIAALCVELTPEQKTQLDAVSAIELGYPHDYLTAWLPRAYTPGRNRPET